ncbi:coiled-coil domain-containing protein R3HCC1L [Pseudoliparis swirei]|uniref:coiled-coil domain-containing protein R3HCC1L n=1 Tax=Pseudoliparis swirei TaxID=2059687 RepID=UPI0024BE38DC|nr:coiled-coil domain-containing protein R3HCC1L [Pseudoliparis swirei]
MESEQATENVAADQPAPTPPPPASQSKKSSQATNKQKSQGSKEKNQTQGDVKPRPRPRYTDKAKKNAKNKKDKAGAADKEAPVEEEVQNGDPEVTEERLHDADEPVNGQPDPTNEEPDATSWLEAASEEGEEESWDTLFNDEGDSLEPQLEELTLKECKKKKKSVQAASADGDDSIELTEDEIAHVVEIYDFPTEFKSDDLLKLFQCYQQKGFEIKWIDDNHVLGLFSHPIAAREALRTRHPLMKLRPLSQSSSEMKAKARSSDCLLPAKERPQTSAMMARKLVIGALGVKSNQTKEQVEAEKKKLQEAREQKRLAAKQKEDAWEGK